jgi:protein-S-isoprenylcysteine O-methyltransferase
MHATQLLYTALVVFWAISEIWLSRRKYAATSARDHGTLRLLLVTIYASIFVAVWFSYAHLLPFSAAWRAPLLYFGMGLMAVGLAFRWWAIRVLGRYFTVNVAIADDHRIVRDGPYRWLRHPSYTGALATFLGFGLCQGDVVSLLVVVIPVFSVFLRRITIEEHVLAEAFPIDYPAYAQQTHRLLPGLW